MLGAMTANDVPRLGAGIHLTDSGLETDLVFNHGVDLPEFAAFPLLDDDAGRVLLRDYYRGHAEVARAGGRGFVFEAPTWRANPDWGARVGYDAAALDRVNQDAIALLREVLDEVGADPGTDLISGCLGPRGDAYRPASLEAADEAADYHRAQVRSFADAGVDLVHAMTLTHVAEAQGIAAAAQHAGLPVALSFTVETDGRLPDGTALGDAIAATDEATDGYPAYFGVNCAHPTHFAALLDPREEWTARIRTIRANASRMSHAELDEAPELDDGDPTELGGQYADLRDRLPGLSIVGGCCGTDLRHVTAIAAALSR